MASLWPVDVTGVHPSAAEFGISGWIFLRGLLGGRCLAVLRQRSRDVALTPGPRHHPGTVLLKMAVDENVSDSVKLAAIKDALDRGGLGAKTEVEITAKPYETILDGLDVIESGSRSEFRRSVGREDEPPPALAESSRVLDAADIDAPIDAELIDEPDGAEFD
jgi:hypothetical protein